MYLKRKEGGMKRIGEGGKGEERMKMYIFTPIDIVPPDHHTSQHTSHRDSASQIQQHQTESAKGPNFRKWNFNFEKIGNRESLLLAKIRAGDTSWFWNLRVLCF